MSSRTPPPSASLFRPSIGPSAWCRPPCPPCSRTTRQSGSQPVVLRHHNDRRRRMLPSLEQRAFDELRDDGVIWTCTSHSCPEFRGRTGMYCRESWSLIGSRPSFTTLPIPRPIGTVHTSPDDAFQFARMLPE